MRQWLAWLKYPTRLRYQKMSVVTRYQTRLRYQCLWWLRYQTMSVTTEISDSVFGARDIKQCLWWMRYQTKSVKTVISDDVCSEGDIRQCTGMLWLQYIRTMSLVTQISDICDRWYISQYVCWLSHQRVYTCTCWLMTVRLNLQSKVIPINSTSVITIQLTQLNSYLHVAGAP